MNLFALDLDGTLEDSRQDMVEAILRVRSDLKLPRRPPEDFWAHVNRGMAHLYEVGFEEIWRQSDDDDPYLEEVRQRFCRDYEANIANHTRLYDGIASALEALDHLGALAVVTNKPEHLSCALLEALGIRHFFQAIIGGDTCAEAKPSALPLAEATRRTEASQTVMIGDSGGDIRCARNFGCPIIWCAWGYNESPGNLAPDRIAHHPDALAQACLELTSISSV